MLVIVIIIVLFSLLVILHEAGHYFAARRGGVGVEEFGIGFPPLAWGKKIKGTLYSINWLPLGGFVRLKGEDTAQNGPDTFGGAKFSTKAKILLAGVGMNLLTAVVIFYALCITGIPALGSAFEPRFLHSQLAQPKQLLIAKIDDGSPAAKAGMKEGDYLLEANGQPVADEPALKKFTSDYAGQQVAIRLRSGGQEKTVTVKLRPPEATNGFLGVGSLQVYKVKYDPLSALAAAFYITGALLMATIAGVVTLLLSIPVLILGLFQPTIPHAAEGASGPLGIIFYLRDISAFGWAYVFLFMANIAVALAAFNVLPLPALDGGRLALIAFQRFTKRRIAPETEAKIHTYGFMALLVFIAIISVYDLRKPH